MKEPAATETGTLTVVPFFKYCQEVSTIANANHTDLVIVAGDAPTREAMETKATRLLKNCMLSRGNESCLLLLVKM